MIARIPRSSTLLICALLATIGVAGCAKKSSTVLKTYPAQAADHPIDVLSEFPSDRQYEQIALLDAKGAQHTFADRSTAGVIEQLKEEARKVGGDAVVIRSTEGGNYNATVGPGSAHPEICPVGRYEDRSRHAY